MTTHTPAEQATELATDDYVAVGVAACYQLEEGELQPVQVLEPIPSAYLETVFQGIPTAYQCIKGITVGQALAESSAAAISGIPETRFCQNFSDRLAAAARTYKSRPTAQAFVALGKTRTDINHSTAKKRILNKANIVTAEDNVRQHEHTHKVL
ncbi:MAG: hypothetical protein ACFBSF_08610 [Leptolyngbyaceae cyanobacterium]